MNEKGVVFFPDPYLEATPGDWGIDDYTDVFFKTEDGVRLHGWFVDAPDKRAVLLWFHGNAGNISHRLENLKLLHEALHIPIFIFDYREYGLSEGNISKKGTFFDAEGAFKYLTSEKEFSKKQILLFGRSLGTALAAYLASKYRCLGIVLEAAFTSTDDMMQLYFPSGIPFQTSATKYDTMSLIHRIKDPILFLHGEYDYTIPVSMAEKLYRKVLGLKKFFLVRGADHNNTYIVGGKNYFEVWKDFLNSCFSISRKNICEADDGEIVPGGGK